MQAAPFECVLGSKGPLAQCAPPPPVDPAAGWVTVPLLWVVWALAALIVLSVLLDVWVWLADRAVRKGTQR